MIILLLYTEIAAYTESCFRALACNAEVHVVKYPLNAEAPFRFSEIENCTYYDRSSYDDVNLLELCKNIRPDILVISGWVDKDYMKVARHFKGKIPTVLSMDNFWLGTPKQYALRIISPLYLKRIFSHVWVPGQPQVEYAQKLGFACRQIMTGFYSADVALYSRFYESSKESKRACFPKRFIYVGRYIAFKNMQTMCNAFIEAIGEQSADWELWCVGTGELWDQRIEHPQIKHLGFVQPGDMAGYVAQTGVFVLPSIVENWGVVVHEFAAAGFPLICSKGVGAASEFLQENKNGFTFDPLKKDELKKIFKLVMSMPSEELNHMGDASHILAMKITPEIWAETALKQLTINN